MSHSIWADVSDDDPIRQGDIIRCPKISEGERWKFILTADCDIAQNKAGQNLTCLDIITAQQWSKQYWAPDQLRRFLDRHTRGALEVLNARLRKNDPKLSMLTSEKLWLWLIEDGEEKLLKAIYGPAAPEQKTRITLTAIRTVLAEGTADPLATLKNVHPLVGRRIEDLRATIGQALSMGGFADFFFLPELPEEDPVGYIVLLRSVSSLPIGNVFQSRSTARLADQPDAPYRLGRLNDRIRFSVSQKLAFLFSRIGMHPDFELACEDAAEILSMELGLMGSV